LASSTSKKVVVQRFEREPLAGFVNPATWLTSTGLELLSVAGNVTVIPYVDIRIVFFVREFGRDPAEGMRRSFLSRPKVNGLWVKLIFRDQDTLEAVAPNDLLQVETWGIHVIPPDTRERIWVPRTALLSAQVLGVMGSPLRSRKPPSRDQIGLFEESA
jgi:hypothetical protein